MKKLLKKILGSCLGFAMAIGIGVAAINNNDLMVADAAGKSSLVQVTSINNLNTSDTYFITNNVQTSSTNPKPYYFNGSQSGGHFSSTEITASAPSSGTVAGAFKLVAVDASNKIYKIKLVSTSKYVTASQASSGGGVVNSNDDSYGWRFLQPTGDTSFNAIYQRNYSSKYAALRCYSNTTWRTYQNNNNSSISTTSGTVFRIYKYVTSYTVTNTATNCTISGPTSVSSESDAVFTITPSTNYMVPEDYVSVTRGGSDFADYTYTISNNIVTLTIEKAHITGNFAITATGVITHAVTGSITNGSLSPTDRVPDGGEYVGYITPNSSSYGRPENSSYVTVIMGGDTVSTDDFDYDPDDGCIYVTNVTGDLEISALCPLLVQNYTITVSITNGTYTGDIEILEGESASVTLSANSGYKLPAEITVTGATYTYSEGLVSLSNPTANVVISVTCAPLDNYTITVNETGGTHTGPSTIQENGSATLTFTQTSGWGQPNDVNVTGATKSWNKGTGVLTLSNPTANVTVTYSAIENKLSSITLSPSSGSYTLGDAFIMPTVTAHYTVAADKNVTASATFSGYDPYSTGAQEVTITYSEGGVEKTATYTANVSAKTITVNTTWTRITSVADLTDGTYIIGYESTAGSGTIVPIRSDGAGATTSSNGIIYTGTTSGSSGSGTLTMATNMTSTGYELTVERISSGVINIKNSDNKYIGASSSGNSSNTARLYNSGNSNETNFTVSFSSGRFQMTASAVTGSYKYFKYNTGAPRYAYYNSGANDTSFYKKGTQSTGIATLIRIVCDSSIDAETGYIGGDKYIGDKIRTTDFVVKKQMDTSTELETITDFTINGGTEVTLEETSNTITIAYGGQTATVVVPASERQAELSSVTLKVGKKAKLDGYVDWSGAEWDFTDIAVFYDWSDDEFDEEVDLQDLVESGDATISPAKPTLGATSYTVSYEYMEVEISDGTVTLKEAVVEDYVSSVSWSGKSLANFKAYGGEQLTIDTVNTWTVKAIYKGAGETAARSFGTGANQFTIKVGSKTVNSLPYTWQTEDDGQYIAVVTGGKSKEDHTNAVANICASINTIDHTETVSGEQTLSNFINTSSDTWKVKKEGTSGDGSEVEIENAGFTFVSDDGYWTGTQIRSYKNSNFTISSSYTIKSISFTFSGTSYDGDLSGTYDNIDATSKTFSNLAEQARINGISITFIGTATVTTHYANQASHFDAQKAVVKYAKAFNEAMNGENVCSGTFENLSTAWATASAAYTTFLSDISSLDETEQTFAKEMLTYATAQWSGNAEAACIEKAMKTYEHVVKTYKLTAFMSEVRPVNPSRFTSIFNIDNSNMASIIVIISMISIAAVGGYFFLRKRKED